MRKIQVKVEYRTAATCPKIAENKGFLQADERP